MRHLCSYTVALGLAVAGAALGGCGSGKTQTVSVSSATTPTQTTATGAHPTAAPTSSPPAAKRPYQASHRTAPAPAFTQTGSQQVGLQAALATVKTHGFTAADTSSYRSDHTLTVLVGIRTGSGEGHPQQAFFFVNGRYIGTDTSQSSATVKVVSQSDTEVTLGYPLYRPHDPLCCPSAGQANVRFQLDNGRLTALDPIPPVSSPTGSSRQ